MPFEPAFGSTMTAATRPAPIGRCSRHAIAARSPHSASLALPNGQRYAYGGATWLTCIASGSIIARVRLSPDSAIAKWRRAVIGAVAGDDHTARPVGGLTHDLDRMLVRIGAAEREEHTAAVEAGEGEQFVGELGTRVERPRHW